MQSDAGLSLSMIGMPITSESFRRRSKLEVDCGLRPQRAIACEPLKSPCLFDIAVDPCELNNLATNEPKTVEKLLTLLQKFNATAVVPLNSPPDPLSDPKYWKYTFTNWEDMSTRDELRHNARKNKSF